MSVVPIICVHVTGIFDCSDCTKTRENIWGHLGKLFRILTHTPSYVAWNQHCLSLTTFIQHFLSAENTYEIAML